MFDIFFYYTHFISFFIRYDILSDGLEDVVTENGMKAQTTLEDEEALDPIDNDDDDIWQDAKPPHAKSNRTSVKQHNKNDNKHKLRQKALLMRPYVAYEPLNNCDSHKSSTWGELPICRHINTHTHTVLLFLSTKIK